MRGGQALVELALCAPVIALLGVGAAAVVEIAEAEAGLDAATRAAAAAAARAPDPGTAESAGQARFAAVAVAYPLAGSTVSIDCGDFSRGGAVIVSSSAYVDIGWAGLVFSERTLELHATAAGRIEPWRSRP